MNQNQKIVAVVVSTVLIGMLLFPPFQVITETLTHNRGFALIFEPPCGACTVNIAQWLIQILVVGAVGGILYILFEKNHNSPK